MRKTHVAICLIGIPIFAFLLLALSDSLFSQESIFLGWFRFAVWGLRLVTSVVGIIYAYYSYRLLDEKYNLFWLPLCIFLGVFITVIIADGSGPLRTVFGLDTMFFSVPAFVLTFIIAIPFEIEKFFKRK